MGGERGGGAGEVWESAPPSSLGPGCMLEMRSEHEDRRLRVRLGRVSGIGVSEVSREAGRYSLVQQTSTSTTRSARLEVRQATTTSWTRDVGYKGRTNGSGSGRLAVGSECDPCEDLGRDVQEEDGLDGERVCSMVRDTGRGVARSESNGRATDGGRRVHDAKTKEQSGDAGIVSANVGEGVRQCIPQGTLERRGDGPLRMGEGLAGPSPGSQASGAGTGRGMAGHGGGGGAWLLGGRAGGVRQSSSSIMVDNSSAAIRMETSASDTRNATLVREGMGTGQGVRSSLEGVGDNRQAQSSRSNASPDEKDDKGLGGTEESSAMSTDGLGEECDQEIAEGEAGVEAETRSPRPEVQQEGRGGGSGGGGHRSRTSSGAQARGAVDTEIRGVDNVASGAEGFDTVEDVIRRCRLPLGGYGLPGYAQLFHAGEDAVFPRTTSGKSSILLKDTFLPFAESVVNTVDVHTVKPWLTAEEWRNVEVIVNIEAFEQRVLRKHTLKEREAAQATVRNSRISAAQWTDLRRKRYVRKLRRTKPKFVCAGFAVMKSDGTHLRFIWNGVAFNTLCNPPPKFTITQMPVMVQRLVGRKKVRFYVAWDYSTWFVQLKTSMEVARWFGVKSGDASEVMNGEPMGWSWACCIAQLVSIGLMRNILNELSVVEGEVSAEICIDNCVIAVHTERLTEARVVEALRKVCAQHGAVLKESALEVGNKVEWMVFVLNAEKGTVKWKKAFRAKLQEASELRMGTRFTYRTLWGLVGLILFAMYAASITPVTLRETLNWIVKRSPTSMAEWDREIDVYDGAVSLVETDEMKHTIPKNLVKNLEGAAAVLHARKQWSPRRQCRNYDAWVIADASTSGYDAYIIISSGRMILESYVGERDIHHRELDVQLKAMERAIEEGMVPVDGASFLLFGDNTVANRALNRGFALWSRSTDVRFEALQSQGVVWEDERVGTESNVSDAWTRIQHTVSRKVRLEGCEHYEPGVLCDCVTSKLQSWAIDGDGFAEKLRKWKDEEKGRKPKEVGGFPFTWS